MPSKTIFTQLKTEHSSEDVTDAVATAMRRLGGQVSHREV